MISSHATTQQQWKLDFRHTHSRRLQTPSRVVLLGMCCPFALPATMLYTGTYQERDKEGNSMIKKATLYTMLGRCLLLSCPCQRNRGRGGALTRFHLSIFFFHRGCSRGLRRKPAACFERRLLALTARALAELSFVCRFPQPRPSWPKNGSARCKIRCEPCAALPVPAEVSVVEFY